MRFLDRISRESIVIRNQRIDFLIRQSRRAKNFRIAVFRDGRVSVSVPFWIPRSRARQYVIEKSAWLIEKLDLFKRLPVPKSLQGTKAEYARHKDSSKAIIAARINYFNRNNEFKFNEIKIKNQKTQWGSCSRRRNLNFNFRVALLPDELRDYVVVHELCHLKEFNHSPRFWRLVGGILPDYKQLVKRLRAGNKQKIS